MWVQYCSQSAHYAEEFFRDAVRDLVDMNKRGGLDLETRKKLEEATPFIGTVRPAHKYKHVSDAAEEVGMKALYAANCKILSKYVHPTAMSVLARIGGKSADPVRKQFVDLGRQLAQEALQKLDSSHVGEAYRKYRQSMNAVLATQPRENRPF